jgi:hypothetical protein
VDFWSLLLIAFLGAFFGNLFFNPSFHAFIKRKWARIKCRRRPSRIVLEEAFLQYLTEPLIRINAIPTYPDELSAKDIKDMLIKLGTEAKQIKRKEFQGIKNKLIDFSRNSGKFDSNLNPLDVLNVLGRATAINLVYEIRQTISDATKPKKKEKKNRLLF